MKAKKAQARLDAKENVALISNNIKLRRFEIKLHRIKSDGVGFGSFIKNERVKASKSLLKEQQTPKNVANANLRKRKSSIKKETQTQQKVNKCVVMIKRINMNTDLNKPSLKPVNRKPLSTLTGRRAMELKLKNQTQTTKSQLTLSPTSNQAECSETQAENTANEPNSLTKSEINGQPATSNSLPSRICDSYCKYLSERLQAMPTSDARQLIEFIDKKLVEQIAEQIAQQVKKEAEWLETVY